MSKTFSNPTFYNSGKPSFGNTFDTDDSGNFTRNKKAKLLYRHNYNGFHLGGVLGSQNNYLLFQRAKTIRNETCASCSDLTSFNTSDLVSGLYTNEKLNGLNVVDLSNNYPCNNVIYTPTLITLGSNPFYWNYRIDPCGALFGNAPCGYDNYENYRVISKPVVTTASSLKDCCVPFCLTDKLTDSTPTPTPPLPPSPLPAYKATGTYTALDGDDNWHVVQFTGNGDITFNYNFIVHYLLVGCGGGGDYGTISYGSGGGGGGGVRNSTYNPTVSTVYAVTVSGVGSANSTAFGQTAGPGGSTLTNTGGVGGNPYGGTGGYGSQIGGVIYGNPCSLGNIIVDPSGSNLNLTYSVGNGGGGGGGGNSSGGIINGGSGGGGGGNGGIGEVIFSSGGGGGGGGIGGGNGGIAIGGLGGSGGNGGNNSTLITGATLSFGNGGGGGGGGISGGGSGDLSLGCVVMWFQHA